MAHHQVVLPRVLIRRVHVGPMHSPMGGLIGALGRGRLGGRMWSSLGHLLRGAAKRTRNCARPNHVRLGKKGAIPPWDVLLTCQNDVTVCGLATVREDDGGGEQGEELRAP